MPLGNHLKLPADLPELRLCLRQRHDCLTPVITAKSASGTVGV